MTENELFETVLPDPSIIPLKALRLGSRNLISSLLNPQKVIPNEYGIPRDWRGLLHLIGLKAEKIPLVACDSDPSARVLNLWIKQDNVDSPPCTIQQLRTFLAELDRYDIIDDTQEMIDQDMISYISEPEKVNTNVTPLRDDIDREIITMDDVIRISQGRGTQTYDAFVVFADEDIDFATELIDNMEKQYGLKLCVKERDLVAGLPFEHKAIIQLISERCNRLIVIISPAYLKSSANNFVVNYAQALGIEQGIRKIIPCLYEPCDLPRELQHIFLLRYQRSTKLYDFWERLKNSIQTPMESNCYVKNTRPVSEEIGINYSENLPDLKPSLTVSNNNHLKPKKDGVKFGSLSNLRVIESNEAKRSISENALNSGNASTQIDPNPVDIKDKSKTKFKFIKKLIPHKTKDKKSRDDEVKNKKKKFFLLKTKIKVPVMS